jgi:hypothetical protein
MYSITKSPYAHDGKGTHDAQGPQPYTPGALYMMTLLPQSPCANDGKGAHDSQRPTALTSRVRHPRLPYMTTGYIIKLY